MSRRDPEFISVNGGGSNAAIRYADNSYAKEAVTVINGNNTITAVATDSQNRSASASSTVFLPASATYSYDNNGNLVSDGPKGYEYDSFDQLTSVTATNVWRTEYVYDAVGRLRKRKEYQWQNNQYNLASEKRYIYDGMLVIQDQERDAVNKPSTTFTRGKDLSGGLRRAGGIGGLLARTDHVGPVNINSYYHADAGGNITCLINSNQIVVARYLYDPFGNVIAASGPMAQVNQYRFSSKEFQENSGLYYYGYRYYSPSMGRWLNRDPMGERGGINLYGFVGNNSINNIDPLGLTTVTSPDWFPGATDVNENGDFTKCVNDGSDATTVLERLTQEQLCEEEQDTADRLKDFEKEWGKKDRRKEATFDTKFFPKVNHYFYVQDMDRIYAWNEINYLGIGMYERWLGNSKLKADVKTWAWKQQYPGPIPSGTWYWLHRGYDDYPNMGSGSSGGSSGSSGGRR